MLRPRLTDDMKTAMKNKDAATLSSIRMILAELKMKDIEARTGGNMDGITDSAILSMMEGMVKKRQESAALYQQGNRPELAAKEEAEIAVLRGYLPKPLSEADTVDAITKAIAATSASSIKDMGAVMNYLKDHYAGQIDMATAGGKVRSALSTAS